MFLNNLEYFLVRCMYLLGTAYIHVPWSVYFRLDIEFSSPVSQWFLHCTCFYHSKCQTPASQGYERNVTKNWNCELPWIQEGYADAEYYSGSLENSRYFEAFLRVYCSNQGATVHGLEAAKLDLRKP